MFSESSLSEYIAKSSLIEEKALEKKIKLAILSSFTINGLPETLKVKCSERGIQCLTYVGNYNQYNQEILSDNSSLYKFLPELTFLILDVRSILGELFYYPYSISENSRREFAKLKAEEIIKLVKTFRKRSDSKLVITNLGIPSYSPYGIAENQSNFGFHEMINEINNIIKKNIDELDSTYLYNFRNFVSKYGEENIFNYQNYFFGDIKISLSFIPKFANELIAYVIATLGLTKKCIVLDLDNTLWGGIVGEDGFDGIKIGPQPPGNVFLEFQRYLKSLKERGVILAINSKNNFEDAMNVIKNHPDMVLREEDFSCIKINWNDKLENMKNIANELNLGIDSFVFFDDDPINRELIRSKLRGVVVPELPNDPAEYIKILENLIEFSAFKITEEDHNRAKMYAQEQKRRIVENNSENIEDFLSTLSIQVSIKPANQFTIPRISQLIMKTNQFNLTTKRYQEEDIRRFSKDDKILIGCARVKDRFGDNGITGVFIVKKKNPDEWELDSFLLSCRVMGREIEKKILDFIINEAKKNKVKKIKAQYIPTQKNNPIADFLPNSGFVNEGEFWVFDVNKSFKAPEFIQLKIE